MGITNTEILENNCTMTLIAHEMPEYFNAKRIFFITDANPLESRGKHANKNSNQILYCVEGAIDVCQNKTTYHTLTKGQYLIHPKMNWIEFRMSEDAVLCVLADQPYDPNEYITE